MGDETRTITLAEMLGDELSAWVVARCRDGTLTKRMLRDEVDRREEELLDRGVVARYAYYATLYALGRQGVELPDG